jgi:exodeoxyribonuclease III
MKKIYSWNVNGIRACVKKGMLNWISEAKPDILAIQETKAQPEQLGPEILEIPGYKSYLHSAERKGYSGVAVYTKEEPKLIEKLGVDKFDIEGRTIILHYQDFVLINCYFPNSQELGKRLDYKLSFCNSILKKCDSLVAKGKNVVLCGDYNIAHTEIDLKNPKPNVKNPGFLPEERNWMTKYIDAGYTDTFRKFYPNEPGHYSWWSYRFKAREKDAGWRIDYHCVNNSFADKVVEAKIHKTIMGSDHCPVSITLDI